MIFVDVSTINGTERISAYESETPGLCVHSQIEADSDNWKITHRNSGVAVATCASKVQALAVAKSLGTVGDWTRPGAELIGDRNFMERARQVLLDNGFTRQAPSHYAKFDDEADRNKVTGHYSKAPSDSSAGSPK